MRVSSSDDGEYGLRFHLLRMFRFQLLKSGEVRDLLFCILFMKASNLFFQLRYVTLYQRMRFMNLRFKIRNRCILILGMVLSVIGAATGLFHVEISTPKFNWLTEIG